MPETAITMFTDSTHSCGRVRGVERAQSRAGVCTLAKAHSLARVVALLIVCVLVPAGTAHASDPSVHASTAGSGPPPGIYRSNAVGMALERVTAEREPESEYVLEISEHPQGIEHTLLHEGVEHRRVLRETEGERVVRENEWEHGELSVEREFDESGRVSEETHFDNGDVVRRSRFEYRDGRLYERSDTDADGAETARERYYYRSDGLLRRVERSFLDGSRGRSEFLYADGDLAEEWHERGRAAVLVSYDRFGRLTLTEEAYDGELIHVERLHYPDDSESRFVSPVLSQREEPERDLVTITEYDARGREVLERRKQAGEQESKRRYEYENDRLSREIIEDERGIEERRYEYDGAGELRSEIRTLNDTVIRRIRYEEDDTRTEERYIDGELALIIEFVEEQRVRERVIRDGEVVREREY